MVSPNTDDIETWSDEKVRNLLHVWQLAQNPGGAAYCLEELTKRYPDNKKLAKLFLELAGKDYQEKLVLVRNARTRLNQAKVLKPGTALVDGISRQSADEAFFGQYLDAVRNNAPEELIVMESACTEWFGADNWVKLKNQICILSGPKNIHSIRFALRTLYEN